MHLNKSPAFMQLSLKQKCVSIEFFWGWNFIQSQSHLGSPTATPHFWKKCATTTWKVTLIFLIYFSFVYLSFHCITFPWFAFDLVHIKYRVGHREIILWYTVITIALLTPFYISPSPPSQLSSISHGHPLGPSLQITSSTIHNLKWSLLWVLGWTSLLFLTST